MTARVWVVDDEPLIRAAVVAVLEEVGYDATPLASAEELYVRLVGGETPPDLLVLDQMLPDESGDQIIRSLRERPQYRDIPVLFLTALSEDDAGRLTDLAPVVTKPFDFRDLVNTVAHLTGTPAQGMADEGPAA